MRLPNPIPIRAWGDLLRHTMTMPPWQRSDLIDAGVAGLILVTITSGALTLDRLVPWIPADTVEIRLWSTIALVFVAAWRFTRTRPQLGETAWVLAPLLAFCGFIALRSLPELPTQRAWDYLQYAGLLTAQALSLAILVNTRRMLWMLMGWIVAMGLILFVIALLGLARPVGGAYGWAPVGSPITFYRLEFLAVITTLVFAGFLAHRPRWRATWYVLAAIMTYGTLASTSRIAPLALVVAATWLGVGLLAKRNYRPVLWLIGGMVVVMVLAGALRGQLLTSRYFHIFKRTQSESALTMAKRPAAPAPPKARRTTPAAVPPAGESIAVTDRTGRIGMFVLAMQLTVERPLIGAGPNGFYYRKVTHLSKGAKRRRGLKHDPVEIFRYPHNVMLEMLAFGGTTGGMLLILAIIGPLVPAIRAGAGNNHALTLSAYLPFALFVSLVSGDIYDLRLFWYVALLTPILMRALEREPT